MKIPTWTECEAALADGEVNPLQRFILDNEPAGSGEDDFREQLAGLIEFVKCSAHTPPEDEPVAWQCDFDDETRWVEYKVLANQFRDKGWKITPLYTRPTNDGLVKAAERYQYLRSNLHRLQGMSPTNVPKPEDLDSSIDAELKEKP